MAKTNAHIFQFNTGEYSKAGMARIDQERVRLAAETQENLFPHVVGKGLVRSGTQFLGNTASNGQARLLQFIKSVDEKAVLELSNTKLRVWVDDALVTRPSVSASVVNGTFTINSTTVTITIASPGVVSWAGHPFVGGERVTFKTSGALPTGIVAGTTYYVLAASLVAGTSFRISASDGGAAINTSGSQSGVHTGDCGWVTTITGNATSQVTGATLVLQSPNRGGTAVGKQQVLLGGGNSGVVHALRIIVARGPVQFRCGSTEGGDEYISETDLEVGTHSLAFTPSSHFWVQFFTRSELAAYITNVTVEAAGVMEITAPWATSELTETRTDQSLDVMFLAHTNWQQRKIERRGDESWSLVNYRTEDGPFSSGRTADVALTPTAVVGIITLTADRPFFTAGHVGALLSMTHSSQVAFSTLAGSDVYTEPVRVSGPYDATHATTDRDIIWSIAGGAWVGTLTLQRSADGPTTGFVDIQTTNLDGSSSINDGLNNQEFWYRWGFKPGAYTSGNVSITLTAKAGGGAGIVRVLSVASALSAAAEVLTPLKNVTATTLWTEGEWSTANGWPSAVALFDGRLWWAREDQFWGSESDDYYAFNLETEGDAGSIQRALATGGTSNNTQWMMPLQRLVFGTDGSEATARASNFDQPLTPTNLTIKDASTQGVAAVSPAKMDGRGVFIQRSNRKVFEILYSLERQDYVSTNLTKFNEEIGGDGLLEIVVQRQPESYIWFVRDDGECPILLYDPGESVAGWFRFIAAPSLAGDAVVESVCVLPEDEQDAVYLSVKRTINGSTVRFVEKLMKHSQALGTAADTRMADAGTFTAGPVSSVTLAHLASETGLVGWGTTSGVSGPITGLSANGSGVISLGATYTNVWVGLKYSWRYKTSKLAYGAQMTALLQKKRVSQLGLLAANIHHNAMTFGADFTTMRKLPRTQHGETVSETAIEATYDFATFPFPGGWDTDSRVCLKGEAPYPATLLGLLIGVETNEK